MPRVQQKRGTDANLTAVDPTPLAGELLVVTDENTLKIGNGSDAYTSLAYVTATPRAHTQAWSTITSTPTTLSGYGITDAVESTDARLTDSRTPTDGSVTTAKIADDAVTYAKLQDVSATDRLLGRSSSGAGTVEEIPCTAFGRSLIDDADAAAALTTLGAAPAASPTFTGDVTIPDKLVHAGDNSAIRFPADDTVTIETAGSERLRVDSTGRVGIGTSTTIGAGSRLHVAEVGSAVLTIQGTDTGPVASPGYPCALSFRNFQFDLSAANARELFRIDAVSREQAIATGGAIFSCCNSSGVTTEYLRIDPYQNGLISALPVVTPAGSAAAPALTISGDSNTGLYQASASANTLSVSTDGTERVRFKATGAVRFIPLSADPGTADAGDVYYNSSTNKLRVYDGSNWVDLH